MLLLLEEALLLDLELDFELVDLELAFVLGFVVVVPPVVVVLLGLLGSLETAVLLGVESLAVLESEATAVVDF